MMMAAMSAPCSRDAFHDLRLADFLALDHVGLALVLGQREIDVRRADARPRELREVHRLPRVRVGQAHGVAGATVEGVLEVQDVRAALAAAGRQVLAHLPVHRGLQGVFHRQRAAIDEKPPLHRRQRGHARERVDKFRVQRGVDIGVRHLGAGGEQQVALHLGVVEMRMIEADGHRAEEAVEVDEVAAGDRIMDAAAAALLEIDDDLEAIHEDVLFQVAHHAEGVPTRL